MKKTPLNQIHHSLGAKMGPFAGYEMPISYSGVSNEHNYGDGILIGLNPNQYPPMYNFNNIVLDTTKLPTIEIYYFK